MNDESDTILADSFCCDNYWGETFRSSIPLLGGCKGKLVFGDTTANLFLKSKEHSHVWKYEDIQQLAIAPGRISILTYETRKIEFGTDQAFNFKVLSGNGQIGSKEKGRKLSRPVVSGVMPEQEVRFGSRAPSAVSSRFAGYPGVR